MDDSKLPAPGVIRRLAAIFYDSLLVIALLMAVSALAIGVRVAILGEQAVKANQSMAAGGAVFQGVLLTTVFAFFYIFWRIKGQTLGMQVWRIRLETTEDKRVSLRQALIRFFAAMLSAICLGAGYWWVWLDKEQCSWHDRLSNTRLVVLPKKSAQLKSENPAPE